MHSVLMLSLVFFVVTLVGSDWVQQYHGPTLNEYVPDLVISDTDWSITFPHNGTLPGYFKTEDTIIDEHLGLLWTIFYVDSLKETHLHGVDLNSGKLAHEYTISSKSRSYQQIPCGLLQAGSILTYFDPMDGSFHAFDVSSSGKESWVLAPPKGHYFIVPRHLLEYAIYVPKTDGTPELLVQESTGADWYFLALYDFSTQKQVWKTSESDLFYCETTCPLSLAELSIAPESKTTHTHVLMPDFYQGHGVRVNWIDLETKKSRTAIQMNPMVMFEEPLCLSKNYLLVDDAWFVMGGDQSEYWGYDLNLASPGPIFNRTLPLPSYELGCMRPVGLSDGSMFVYSCEVDVPGENRGSDSYVFAVQASTGFIEWYQEIPGLYCLESNIVLEKQGHVLVSCVDPTFEHTAVLADVILTLDNGEILTKRPYFGASGYKTQPVAVGNHKIWCATQVGAWVEPSSETSCQKYTY